MHALGVTQFGIGLKNAIKIAEEALELIKVDYEELPAVFDPLEAIKEGAPLVHDGVPNNISFYIKKEFGGKPGPWAYAESPLVDGDAVVVTPGGAEATIVALNKKTGAVIWKFKIDGPVHATPSIASATFGRRHGNTRRYQRRQQRGENCA